MPQAAQAANVLVPVALSSTHVGFNTVRLEPTWMTPAVASERRLTEFPGHARALPLPRRAVHDTCSKTAHTATSLPRICRSHSYSL